MMMMMTLVVAKGRGGPLHRRLVLQSRSTMCVCSAAPFFGWPTGQQTLSIHNTLTGRGSRRRIEPGGDHHTRADGEWLEGKKLKTLAAGNIWHGSRQRSQATVVRVVGLVVHHQATVDEVEAIGSRLERMLNHFVHFTRARRKRRKKRG